MSYTMSINAVGKQCVARGTSLPGETWEDTLKRLYQETLPPGEPPRRVIYMTYHDGQIGSRSNLVILGCGGTPEAPEKQDAPLLVTTDPPQF